MTAGLSALLFLCGVYAVDSDLPSTESDRYVWQYCLCPAERSALYQACRLGGGYAHNSGFGFRHLRLGTG